MRRTGRRRFAGGALSLALLACLPVAGSRCASLPGKAGEDASLFSRLADRSWIAADPARVFAPATLYEEIDGEAELFLPYGFEELTVGYLRPARREPVELRLELFRHATPRDAFGVFSQHRFPDRETVDVGAAEAIVSDASLDFFQGTRFVRIRAASRAAGRGDLESLGRELSALLPGTGDPPPETEALRVQGFVGGSIVFHRRAMLGYEVLAPGYEAKCSDRGRSVTLVLITPEDAGPAPGFRERLSRALPGYTRIEEDLSRADLPSGTLWLLSSGGYYIGAAGDLGKEEALPILHEMAARCTRIADGRNARG